MPGRLILPQDIVTASAVPELKPIVEFLGDSITDQGKYTDATNARFNAIGFCSWVRVLTGGRIASDIANNLGVSGATTTTMLSGQVPTAVASSARISVILIGTNDVKGGSISTATTLANIAAAVTALTAVGKTVILVPILPRSSPVTFSTAQAQQAERIRRWMHETYGRASGRVFIADATSVMMDASTGNGKAASLFQDGLHLSPYGSYVVARVVADIINSLIPASDRLIVSALDLYSATDNIYGAQNGNPVLAGTGGTTANGATGNVPTSWTGSINAAGAAFTAAFSKVSHPTITGMEVARVTLGGTGDSKYINFQSYFNWGSGVVAGDQVIAECEAWVAGLTNVNSVFVQLYPSAGSPVVYDMFSTADKGVFPTVTERLVFRTPPLTIPGGSTQGVMNCVIRPNTSGSVAGTVDWGRASVRKI